MKEIALYIAVAGVVAYIIYRLYNKEEYFSSPVVGSYTAKYPRRDLAPTKEKYPTYQLEEDKKKTEPFVINDEEKETINSGIELEKGDVGTPSFMMRPHVEKMTMADYNNH
jgi:hypothetical protein